MPKTRHRPVSDAFDRNVGEVGAENQSFEDLPQLGGGTRFIP